MGAPCLVLCSTWLCAFPTWNFFLLPVSQICLSEVCREWDQYVTRDNINFLQVKTMQLTHCGNFLPSTNGRALWIIHDQREAANPVVHFCLLFSRNVFGNHSRSDIASQRTKLPFLASDVVVPEFAELKTSVWHALTKLLNKLWAWQNVS